MNALEKYAAKQHLTQQLAKQAGVMSELVMMGKRRPSKTTGVIAGSLLGGPIGALLGHSIQAGKAAKYDRQALLRKVLLGAGAAGAAGAYAGRDKK